MPGRVVETLFFRAHANSFGSCSPYETFLVVRSKHTLTLNNLRARRPGLATRGLAEPSEIKVLYIIIIDLF